MIPCAAEQWATGQPFHLRYDPAESDPENRGPHLPALDREHVVSAEAGAHNADDDTGWDYRWPTAVIGGLVFLVLLAWAVCGWLNRAVAAGLSVPMRVVVRGHSGNLGANNRPRLTRGGSPRQVALGHRLHRATPPVPSRYADPVRPPLAVWLVPIPAGVSGAARGHFLAAAPLVVLGLLVVTTFRWAWYTPAPKEG